MTVDTLSGAPNTVAVANIDEQLPLSATPSVMQDAVRKRDLLLLHDQKADVDIQEQKPDLAARGAKFEDLFQKHFPDSIPRKRTSHVSHVLPTPKLYLTRSQPTQFWRLWKEILLGRR